MDPPEDLAVHKDSLKFQAKKLKNATSSKNKRRP